MAINFENFEKKTEFLLKIENFINMTMSNTKSNFLRYMVVDLIEKSFFNDLEMSKFNFIFKFSRLIAKSTFFYGFDLKIGFLGSIYPYPELG